MKYVQTLVSAVALLSLFPLQAFAATNQAMIQAGLKQLDTEGSIMHMSAKIHLSELDENHQETSSGDMAFQVKTKNRPTNDPAIADADGRFTLSTFTLNSNEKGPFSSLKLDQPLVIEWVNRYPMRYLRLQQIPDAVANFFDALGVNILGIQKTWIGFDWKETALGQSLNGNPELSTILPLFTLTDTNGIDASPLIVTGIEKSFKNAAGETITRFRAKMNPVYIDAAYQKQLNAAKTDTEKELAMNDYRDQKILADSLGFAINYNQNATRIERIEMGGKVLEPRERCSLVNGQNRCTTSGTTMATYSVGITFFPDDLRPIHHPPGWRWFQDIVDRLQTKASTLGF